MPGVPSGRGCDACRQQKKKCDPSIYPCPRCKRLNVACVGLGQRRFKFVHDEKTSSPGNIIQSKLPATESVVDLTSAVHAIAFVHIPSNPTTRLMNAFADKIKPALGIKFNLAWTYGDYLNYVPSRLGKNEALDAATDTFIAAIGVSISDPGADHTPMLLEKYGHSLASLRRCLDDPVKAKAPETLAAILFLWNCQLFIMQPGSPTSAHSQGVAQIIRLRGFAERSEDPFEANLLLAIRAVVLFDSLYNGKVEFTDEEWVAMFDSKQLELSPEGQGVQCMTRLPNLMRRSKIALFENNQHALTRLRTSAHTLRDDLEPSLSKLRQRWRENAGGLVKPQSTSIAGLVRCHFLRSYALGLAIAIFINEVRLALCPNSPSILAESHSFALEILGLARDACQYRPLGAYALGVCLLAAEFGTDDAITTMAIREMRADYASDFQGFRQVTENCYDRLQLICGRQWSRSLERDVMSS